MFSVILGSLSIFSVSYLSWVVAKNNSYLLTLFLISFNIYLISFSQEIRVYSLLFFTSSIFLILFLKIFKEQKNYFLLAIYFLSSIFLVALHPFALIVFFSSIIYLLIKNFKDREKYFSLHTVNLLIFLISIYIYYSSFFLILDQESNNEYFWMTNPDLKFYTNFYFSSFFGSRLMGVIFLILLLTLLFQNYKKILNLELVALFLTIIFLSYFLPILFGYIYNPILVNRYIIFILIPIIIIISTSVYDLKNDILKKTLIFLVIIFTLGNHFTEQTFKQFFKKRIVSKPQYTAALIYINNSDYKNYILKAKKMKNKMATIQAVNHYITYLNDKNKLNVNYVSVNKKDKNKFLWHICFQDFNGKDCKVEDLKNDYKVIRTEYFNNVELKLLEII